MPVKRFTLQLRVTFASEKSFKSESKTPVRFQADFEKLLRLSKQRLIDPNTLVVKRRVKDAVRTYPVQYDERFYTGNQGWIAWQAVELQSGGEWWLEVELRAADGRLAKAPDRPMVGVGDEIFYNGDRWHPVTVPGMHPFPIAVDWNGDGLIDLISSSHYSNTQGMPWSGIFFWRNIGSNATPRFAPPMWLMADGGGSSGWQ